MRGRKLTQCPLRPLLRACVTVMAEAHRAVQEESRPVIARGEALGWMPALDVRCAGPPAEFGQTGEVAGLEGRHGVRVGVHELRRVVHVREANHVA